MDRFKVIASHGEGSSVFSIVDTLAPEDEQPCVVKSYRDNPSDAAMHCLALNDRAGLIRIEPQPTIGYLPPVECRLRHLGGVRWAIPSRGIGWIAPSENHKPVLIDDVWYWKAVL